MTGAATFVGFRTIRALIEAGYLVLVVVETKEEHDLLRRYTPWTYQKRIRIGQPTNILEESDMGIDPVCIERATYIIHMAAPLLQEKASSHYVAAYQQNELAKPVVPRGLVPRTTTVVWCKAS